MKIIVMTKPSFFVEEDKIINVLFEEGLDNLQLYKPGTSPVYSERLLSLLPESYYSKITVHENYYLKKEYGLAGIHIGNTTDDIPAGYKGHVTRTCKEISSITNAKNKSDDILLRNVFDCITEKNDKASFSYKELVKASSQGLIDRKVYAAGGMNIDNIQYAKELGFGGVVICGDLWNRFNIHQGKDFKEIISHFKRLRKAIN